MTDYSEIQKLRIENVSIALAGHDPALTYNLSSSGEPKGCLRITAGQTGDGQTAPGRHRL